MEKIKNNLPVILLSVSSTLLLVAVILLASGNKFSFSNKTGKEETKKENTTVVDKKSEPVNNQVETKEEKQEQAQQSTQAKQETSVKTETKQEQTSVEQTPVIENTPQTTTQQRGTEDTVITHFQSTLTSFESNTSDKTLGEKIKSGFTSIVDFIFYDKEIKGYTFKELTTSAKLKVIGLALKIDNKIDSYFPGYKDTINEKYRAVKEKLAELYAEYTVKLCDTVGADTCNQFKQDLESMKTSFGITGDYLKEAFSKGKDKLKEWYENWR